MADADRLESIGLELECDHLSGIDIHVRRFALHEALDEPYQAEIDLLIHDPDLDPADLVGRDCALVIRRSPLVRRLAGLVRTVQEGERTDASVFARIIVSPALSLLALRRNTRIFQEKTAPEVLDELLSAALGEYGRSVQLDLSASYARREYCVQYQETDLDFARRLMEEEGIHFGFDHQDANELLLLRDANASFARVESATDPIVFEPHNLHARERECIHQLTLTHRHTTTSVALRDWDWSTPGSVVEETESGTDAAGRERESYEHGLGRTVSLWDYSTGTRGYQQRDASRQKQVRLEGHTRDALVGRGIGRVIGLAPGTTFALVGHPGLGMDGEYLVTRVIHTSAPAEAILAQEPTADVELYHNRFECIPLEVSYRPARRNQKPSIPSIQTAIVTGPAGEEIHTDEHGRIKVRFHWDRENPADETSSCWVRCEQAWAGAGWGFWWLPRIGMEVVVHFVHGDPDRPVVTGCVYNGTNGTPYPLPDDKTKSTIKSNSSPGGGGSNELRFEDKAGSEEIYTHAQKDYNEVVENDHTTLVHNDQRNTVDNDQRQTVHGNQTERVDGDQDMSVGANREVHVESNFDETVDGTETRQVTGDVTETFDANETRSVGASLSEDIASNETRTLGGNQTETVQASQSLTITGASTVTVGGSMTQTVVGGITTTTPAAHTLMAVGGMTVNAASATWVGTAGINIIAPGGVTFIDCNNDWMGQMLVDVSPISTASFGLKIEVGGMVGEICGAKVNTHVFHLSLGGVTEQKEGTEMIGKVINADTGTRLNLLTVKVKG